ncbi:MAG: hypothetical protein U5K79_01100 [Cyclobacteriaceae bacterium]|nr:hypothetical protein [Cyclobacteriaceae bacterium]
MKTSEHIQQEHIKDPMDRRRFFVNGSRMILFGGLAGISGLLLFRRRFGNPDTCFSNPFCGGCSQFNSCKVVATKIDKKP